MYWLQPPPYLRWAAAATLVIGAFLWDLRGTPSVPHPFAADEIAAGSPLGEADVVWRSLPRGAFPIPDLAAAVTAVDLSPGDPISAAVLTGAAPIPEGWWAIPLDVSDRAGPGDRVLLVVVDPPMTLSGIVVESASGDAMSLSRRPALVAVPATDAAVVAAAGAAGLLVTAIRP